LIADLPAEYGITYNLSLLGLLCRYDVGEDRIKCWAETTFGPHRWLLPPRVIDYPTTNSEVQASADTAKFQVSQSVSQPASESHSLFITSIHVLDTVLICFDLCPTVLSASQRLVGGSEALRQRLFAKLLLEGEVVAGLARFRGFLNTKPSSLVSSFAGSQKVTALLSALTKHRVDSRAKLFSKWYIFIPIHYNSIMCMFAFEPTISHFFSWLSYQANGS
jgi:hypothetical protein